MHCGKWNSVLRSLVIQAWVAVAVILLSTPASAQTICNAQLVVGFPNGDNLNRIVGLTVRINILAYCENRETTGGFAIHHSREGA
jgi:hypothetical protein